MNWKDYIDSNTIYNGGKLLYRFCNGKVTKADIESINKQVVDINTKLPSDIKYATYYNRDRDAINTALFETRCNQQKIEFNGAAFKDSLIIFSDNIKLETVTKHIYLLIIIWSFGQHVQKMTLNYLEVEGD